MQARGYAAQTPKSQLEPFAFKRRAVGATDVHIDIKFCGICHSDVHQARDEWGGSTFPIVPGHEIAGVVVKVGERVTKFKAGDRVGVGCMVSSCRTCDWCKQGEEELCSKCIWTYNSKVGEGEPPTYGGYSNTVVVDQDFVLRIPENLPLNAAAPLLCAGITLYSPLKRWGAGPGKRVAIVGLGGLGHMGLKLAKKMGAEVTVLSQSLRKKDDGMRLGADHFYATSDPKTFETLKNHFDLIITTVSAEMDWDPFVAMLRPFGTIVPVGLPEKNLVSLKISPFVQKNRALAGSIIGGIAQTQEMLDFCGKHGVVCEIEQIPISMVNEAYERILKSDVRYRFVIDMSTLEAPTSS